MEIDDDTRARDTTDDVGQGGGADGEYPRDDDRVFDGSELRGFVRLDTAV